MCLQGARNEVLAAGLDKLQAAQVGVLPATRARSL